MQFRLHGVEIVRGEDAVRGLVEHMHGWKVEEVLVVGVVPDLLLVVVLKAHEIRG